MALVVSGLPNKAIAAKLNMSEITIKVRRHQIMHKMHAATLPDLVRIAEKLKSRRRMTAGRMDRALAAPWRGGW
jgi:FixJ family two-component response regulator